MIPLSGEMGEAQKAIPFLREMSRSDKRFADVLRLPFSPEKGGQFALSELVGGGYASDSSRYDM